MGAFFLVILNLFQDLLPGMAHKQSTRGAEINSA